MMSQKALILLAGPWFRTAIFHLFLISAFEKNLLVCRKQMLHERTLTLTKVIKIL